MKKLMILAICALSISACAIDNAETSSRSRAGLSNYAHRLLWEQVNMQRSYFDAALLVSQIMDGTIPEDKDGKYGNDDVSAKSSVNYIVNSSIYLETDGKTIFDPTAVWKVCEKELRPLDVAEGLWAISDEHCETQIKLVDNGDGTRTFWLTVAGEDPETYKDYTANYTAEGSYMQYVSTREYAWNCAFTGTISIKTYKASAELDWITMTFSKGYVTEVSSNLE